MSSSVVHPIFGYLSALIDEICQPNALLLLLSFPVFSLLWINMNGWTTRSSLNYSSTCVALAPNSCKVEEHAHTTHGSALETAESCLVLYSSRRHNFEAIIRKRFIISSSFICLLLVVVCVVTLRARSSACLCVSVCIFPHFRLIFVLCWTLLFVCVLLRFFPRSLVSTVSSISNECVFQCFAPISS